MGTLSSLLKQKTKTVSKPIKTRKIQEQMTPVSLLNKVVDNTQSEQLELIGTLTVENYEIVKNSVVTIDTNGKNRREIIIGMFGSIKNPTTNKRFTIPNLSYMDEDYAYIYAKHMKTLVNRPDEFTKIMNWE